MVRWFGWKKKKKEAEEGDAAEPEASEPNEAESAPTDAGSGTAVEEPAPAEAPESGGETVAAEPEPPPAEPQPEPAAPEPPAEEPKKKPRFWQRLKQGLTKTRKSLTSLFSLTRKLDEDFVDELEAELYAADFGPGAVEDLVHGEKGVRSAWKEKKIENTGQVRDYLKSLLRELLTRRNSTLGKAETGTTVILVAGVNGTGKTTSIAKIAHTLKADGHKIVLAAADTFRAAAVEQLTIWSERLGVDIVTGEANADPASVAFRGAEKAVEIGADYLIVDTAGRLHTQKNLMKELEKIRNVLRKKIDGAPHERL
ncbi:MAG: signal recognition particle receptor subunit alpha [Planctomycetota bacterium]